MSSYVLLVTYPGSPDVHVASTGAVGSKRIVTADRDNLTTLRTLAQKLLAQNVVSSAQIFENQSEIMYSEAMEEMLNGQG
jgi:poly(3-hydroxybutyrate) depolymerase